MRISKTKLAVIHVAKRHLGISNEAYRDLLRVVAGVESSKELDNSGFEALMQRFSELGFESTQSKRSFGHRIGMATPKQVEYIRRMWKIYTGAENENSLNHFLENRFGIASLRFVDSITASKVITALKDMTGRKVLKSSNKGNG